MKRAKTTTQEGKAGAWVVCNRCSRSVKLEAAGLSKSLSGGRLIMTLHQNVGATPQTCSGAFTSDWSRESEEQLQARLDREEEVRQSPQLQKNRLRYINRARDLLTRAVQDFGIQNFFGRDPVEVFGEIRKSALEAARELEKYANSFEVEERDTWPEGVPVVESSSKELHECEGGCGKVTPVPCPAYCRDCWKTEKKG